MKSLTLELPRFQVAAFDKNIPKRSFSFRTRIVVVESQALEYGEQKIVNLSNYRRIRAACTCCRREKLSIKINWIFRRACQDKNTVYEIPTLT